LARQGSGAASRSVPGGVSVWHKGGSSETSFAEKIDYPKNWDLKVLLVFVGGMQAKKVGSTEGMALTQDTSPFFKIGVEEAEKNVERIQEAMRRGDWKGFGKVIEDECFRLHALCMTTTPNILYWSGETVAIFQKLYELRSRGIMAFFTVDAGPQVHIVCKNRDIEKIKSEINTISGISSLVECGIAGSAQVI